MLGLDASFSAENFEWSNVENGVRMQKLWPVKVWVPKLTKTGPIRTKTAEFGTSVVEIGPSPTWMRI